MEEFCCDSARKTFEEFGVNDHHYHCARCNGKSSMMGHYTTFCRSRRIIKNGKVKPNSQHHFCCPGDCELENA